MARFQLLARNRFFLLAKKNWQKIPTSIFLAVGFLVVYAIYNRFIYSFGFTDEGDNISIGKYLLSGKLLYQDLFSQHQPLTYFLSAFVQKLTHPDNILLVIRRHRQFVMLFSFLSITFLTFRFGVLFAPLFFILEITKYYFLGHLFLAEGLVIYPLIYLFLLWFSVLQGKKLRIMDSTFASLAIFFVIFNLLPTAGVVSVIFFTFVITHRRKKQVITALIAPMLLGISLLGLFVPIESYIEGTVWANVFYYIPNSSGYAFNVEQSLFNRISNAVLYPLTVFFRPENALISVYRLLSIAWVSTLVFYLWLTKKNRTVIAVLLLLFIANPRPAFESNIFYHAFHSLPHFALFITSIGVFLSELFKYKTRYVVIPIVAIFGVFLLFLFNNEIYVNKNIVEEDISYINFAEIFTYSTAIETLSEPSDTLAVIPHEELLYWYPNILPATRFLFYKAWVSDVPKFRSEIHTSFSNNPPTFVYWPEYRLEPFLKTAEYASVPRNTATYSALHIYREKLPEITNDQWNQLEVHGFGKP